ncbi:MAG: YicC/YloC family endoribonuclease [Phycisphaerae bacterium]
MIHSMTGFGEARIVEDGVSFVVEIRSLNNRYFKASIKVPELFQRYETEIDKQLRPRIGRGSVNYTLRIKDENPASAYTIQTELLGEYARQLQSVAGQDGAGHVDLARLIEIPGVLQPPEIEESVLAAQFEVVRRLTEEAVTSLIEMRRREGAALKNDLDIQLEEIRTRGRAMAERSPEVVVDYQKRLHARLRQLLNGTEGSNIDLKEEALCREVALFAERCDVNEEVSRIESHLEQFASLCVAPEPTGRKLDFLAQELLREANTIGSKSNDAEIARQVVEMKAAVDRIKEQVQNVA